MTTHEKIILYLKKNHVDYEYLEHEATTTCEEAAKVRGIDQSLGGKSLLFKDKKGFKLFSLSSALTADSKKIRNILSSQKLRFATEDELMELAGVPKGALPPFGNPILPFPHYIDESLFQFERIAFNPGILTASIILKTSDYLPLVRSSIRTQFSVSI